MNVSLILISPKGASNVGGVARAMGNFGLSDLRIVKPRCNIRGLATKRMSMTAYPLIEKARIFSTFEEAQKDLTYSIALSGRLKDREIPVGRPQDNLFHFAETFHSQFSRKDKIGLVFGREESGLRLAEINRCDQQIYIPTSEEMPSINLTSAVAITLGAFYFHSPKKAISKTTLLLKKNDSRLLRPEKGEEEIFFSRIHELLARVKFLNPQNPDHLLEDVRDMYHRARMSKRDLRILFGILRSIETTLDSYSKKNFKQV
jgi:TrmH family RNA methyltransferase